MERVGAKKTKEKIRQVGEGTKNIVVKAPASKLVAKDENYCT
jgi:hypothetical protein